MEPRGGHVGFLGVAVVDPKINDVRNMVSLIVDELQNEFEDLDYGSRKERNLVSRAYKQGKAVQTANILKRLVRILEMIG